jgi:hypothetical protein
VTRREFVARSLSTLDTVSLIDDTVTVMDMDQSLEPLLAESWTFPRPDRPHVQAAQAKVANLIHGR